MLKVVLVNLISNALKFISSHQEVEIEIGCTLDLDTEVIIFVRDNGVGAGIGLANIRRIISRHGSRTWAEGKVDHGATFYFSLPQST